MSEGVFINGKEKQCRSWLGGCASADAQFDTSHISNQSVDNTEEESWLSKYVLRLVKNYHKILQTIGGAFIPSSWMLQEWLVFQN